MGTDEKISHCVASVFSVEVKLKEKPQVGVFFVKPSQSINKTVIPIAVEYIYILNRLFDLLSFIN